LVDDLDVDRAAKAPALALEEQRAGVALALREMVGRHEAH
jgi:hypothetical protein